MEKRFLLALLLTFVFLLFWSYLAPKTPQIQPPQPNVNVQPVPVVENPVPQPEPKDLKQADMGTFIVNYSPAGGYIASVVLKEKSDELIYKDIGFVDSERQTIFEPSATANTITFRNAGKIKKFTFDGYVILIEASSPSSEMLVFDISSIADKANVSQRYEEIFCAQAGQIVRKYPWRTKSLSFGRSEFAGGRDRYYCCSLLKGEYDVRWVNDKTQGLLYLDKPGQAVKLYLGPQIGKNLQPFGLQGIVNYGFFHGIGLLMIKVLSFFHLLTRNWGLAIILFSVVIYFVLFPFTASSMKAMRKIQQVQPELEAMKEKYKDNPAKLNKEMVEFYKVNKINPLGGCLPLFLQFPVFIALYQVIFRFYDLKGASFFWIKDLALPDGLFKLPITIPFLNTNEFNLLPILVIILGVLQQKFTASSPAGTSQQKSMAIFMSIFIGFIFYNFPSALVLYWFIQNLLTFTYQSRLAKTTVST